MTAQRSMIHPFMGKPMQALGDKRKQDELNNREVITLTMPRPQIMMGPLPYLKPLDPVDDILSPLEARLGSLRSSSSASVLTGVPRNLMGRNNRGSALTGATLLGGEEAQ